MRFTVEEKTHFSWFFPDPLMGGAGLSTPPRFPSPWTPRGRRRTVTPRCPRIDAPAAALSGECLPQCSLSSPFAICFLPASLSSRLDRAAISKLKLGPKLRRRRPSTSCHETTTTQPPRSRAPVDLDLLAIPLTIAEIDIAATSSPRR